jgi:hypothetical protein
LVCLKVLAVSLIFLLNGNVSAKGELTILALAVLEYFESTEGGGTS